MEKQTVYVPDENSDQFSQFCVTDYVSGGFIETVTALPDVYVLTEQQFKAKMGEVWDASMHYIGNHNLYPDKETFINSILNK